MVRRITTHLLSTAILAGVFVCVSVIGGSILAPETAAAQTRQVDSIAAGVEANQGSSWFWSALDWFGSGVFGAVGAVILSLMGMLLGIAGFTLNGAVEITVLGMGQLLSEGGGMAGIEAAWVVLRDLANIGFIFVLIFIGFAVILRYDKANYKSMLIYLVIAALLVNFSLFFTRVIIDTANLMAAEAIQQIQLEDVCSGGAGSAAPVECLNTGFSGALMQHMDLTSLYDATRPDGSSLLTTSDGQSSQTLNVLLVSAGGSIFILISAFVFFTAAILLVIRFVVLVFLMVLSPLAFAGMVLPATRGRSQAWFKALFAQAFFAPAFFILIWAAIQVLNGISGNLSGGVGQAVEEEKFAAAILGEASASGVFISFAIATGFMVASLILARKLANVGSLGLVSIASQTAGTLAFGTAGRFLRNTVGRFSSRAAQSQWLQDRASGDKGNKVTQAASRLAFRGARDVSNRSFDARNVGGWSQRSDIGAGKGIKGGFEDTKKAKKKRETEFAGAFGYDEEKVESKEAEKEEARQREEELKSTLKQQKQPVTAEEKQQQQELKTEIETQQQKQKDADDAITTEKTRRQQAYADSLVKPDKKRPGKEKGKTTIDPIGQFPFLEFNSSRENKEISQNIKKETKKGPDEKKREQLLDTVRETVEGATKKDEE